MVRTHDFMAVLLIIVGIILLLANFGLLPLAPQHLWPLGIVVLGAWIVFRAVTRQPASRAQKRQKSHSSSSSSSSDDYARFQRLKAAQAMRVSGRYSEEEVLAAYDRVDNP